jgi:hypothetical protein
MGSHEPNPYLRADRVLTMGSGPLYRSWASCRSADVPHFDVAKLVLERRVRRRGLEAGASWEYLTDGGAHWLPGSTTLLHMIGDKIGALLAGFRIK